MKNADRKEAISLWYLGATVRELAERYKISRGAMREILLESEKRGEAKPPPTPHANSQPE
jgi:transposase